MALLPHILTRHPFKERTEPLTPELLLQCALQCGDQGRNHGGAWAVSVSRCLGSWKRREHFPRKSPNVSVGQRAFLLYMYRSNNRLRCFRSSPRTRSRTGQLWMKWFRHCEMLKNPSFQPIHPHSEFSHSRRCPPHRSPPQFPSPPQRFLLGALAPYAPHSTLPT